MDNLTIGKIGRERMPHDVADKVQYGDPKNGAADVPDGDVNLLHLASKNGAKDDGSIPNQRNLYWKVDIPWILAVLMALVSTVCQRN